MFKDRETPQLPRAHMCTQVASEQKQQTWAYKPATEGAMDSTVPENLGLVFTGKNEIPLSP